MRKIHIITWYYLRQTYLMENHILQNGSEPGFCLATAIRSNWPAGATPNFSGITNQMFTETTGLSAGGVQISQLGHAEANVQRIQATIRRA